MDCILPGSSVHGIFQARVLEWGAIAFSGETELHCNKKSHSVQGKKNGLGLRRHTKKWLYRYTSKPIVLWVTVILLKVYIWSFHRASKILGISWVVRLKGGEGNGTPLQYSRLENPHGQRSLSYVGEGNGNPLQCSCLENPRDGGSLVRCRLWGRTESGCRVGHDWSDLADLAARLKGASFVI